VRARLLPLLLLLTACSPAADEGPAPVDAQGTVTVRVADVEVEAEVADDDAERARGLMGRTEVPPGTGMVFLYDAPVDGQFYMFQVSIPLTATFAREGRVVGVVDMEPCAETDPAACPRYGPGEPFDTVLETAPEEVEGRVDVGDPLVVAEG
jgi:uncharacterized protein